MVPSSYEKSERNASIYQDRLGGLTYKKLGEKYGLSGDRVRQIFDKEARKEAQKEYAQAQRTLPILIANIDAIRAIAEN